MDPIAHHTWRLAIFVGCAVSGLLLLCAVLGLTGAAEPFWWGGKGLFMPLFGMMALIPVSFLIYPITRFALRNESVPTSQSKPTLSSIAVVATIYAVAFYPIVYLWAHLVDGFSLAADNFGFIVPAVLATAALLSGGLAVFIVWSATAIHRFALTFRSRRTDAGR